MTFHITKIYPKHRRSIPRLKEEHRKDEAVKREIVFLWVCFDQMCGKRLVGTLSDILSMLLHRGRINGDQEVLAAGESREAKRKRRSKDRKRNGCLWGRSVPPP